jgi:hypothetical protein
LARGAFQRPHTVAEFDAGVLTLPGAEVCVRADDCNAASPALLVSAWPLYRAHERFTFGAGLTIGFNPARDVNDGESPVPRRHSSTFFVAEATARYLPWASNGFQAWLGVTTGLIVVSDAFRIERNQPEQRRVGDTGSSLASEGLALGGAAGATWALTSRLRLGGNLRLATWLLPEVPKRTALGDTASLSGVIPVLAVAVTLSYSPG